MTSVTVAAHRRWWRALTGILAVGYLMMGILGPAPAIRWPFVLGGVLVAGGLMVGGLGAVRGTRPAAWAALVVGALAPVVTTWWSVFSPVTALLILGCGTAALRATRPVAHRA